MRNYAIIKNNVVLNVHWADLRNARALAAQIEGAISLDVDGLPVQSGDDYLNGEFYRSGVNITGPIKASRALEATDALTGSRGVEDLIYILILKNVLNEEDIPTALKIRLDNRKAERAKI